MSEPTTRQRLREAPEKAAAEREASEAAEAVSGALETTGRPLRTERTAAEREVGEATCDISCDPDCDAVCHSDHHAGPKKDHWPWDCLAADRYDWGSVFNNGMVRRLRDERDQARAMAAHTHAAFERLTGEPYEKMRAERDAAVAALDRVRRAAGNPRQSSGRVIGYVYATDVIAAIDAEGR